MNEYIAYCGLDCEACEARLATVNNDDVMRQRVARVWSDLICLPESMSAVRNLYGR
jgi:hypothetical protein